MDFTREESNKIMAEASIINGALREFKDCTDEEIALLIEGMKTALTYALGFYAIRVDNDPDSALTTLALMEKTVLFHEENSSWVKERLSKTKP